MVLRRVVILIFIWQISSFAQAQQVKNLGLSDSVINAQWEQFSTLLIKPGSYHYGILKTNKWVTLTLHNASRKSSTFNIRFHNPHINQLAVFKNHATTPAVITGDWYQFTERPILFRDFIIPIEVPPHHTDSILLFLNKRGESLSISLDIITPSNLQELIWLDYFWIGALLCFTIIISILSIYVGLNLKDPLYLSFALYWLLSMAWLFNNAGFFYQYFWPDTPLWHYKSRTLFSVSSICAYLLFLTIYFRSKIRLVDKIVFFCFALFLSVKLYGVLTAPSVEFKLPVKYTFVVVSGAGLAAFLSYLFYFLLKRGNTNAGYRFQLIGLIMYCLMVLQEVLLQFGFSYMPFQGITDFIPFLFFITQFLLITTGLVLQFYTRMKDTRLRLLFSALADERALAAEYSQIQEGERSRIGRDIHDELGGLLVSIKLSLSNLKLRFFDPPLHRELDQTRVMVDSSINQLHQIVHDLVSPTISTDNFKELITERISLFDKVSAIHFKQKIAFDAVLPKSILVHLYRIICELINNAVQHAQCSAITIECQLQKNKLVLLFADNGQGFASKPPAAGFGLKSIEGRVNLMRGQLTVTDTNEGVTFLIEIDLTQYHEANTLSL